MPEVDIVDIPDHLGYGLDRLGNVYTSCPTDGYNTKIPWTRKAIDFKPKYAVVKLRNKKHLVHILMLTTFRGPRPSKRHISRHLNDIKHDNRIDNLVWGTSAENTHDAIKNRRLGREEIRNIPIAILEAIRDSRDIRASFLARLYGINVRHVYAVRNRETWDKLFMPRDIDLVGLPPTIC